MVVVLLVVFAVIPAVRAACSGIDPARRADALKVLETLVPWRPQKVQAKSDPE